MALLPRLLALEWGGTYFEVETREREMQWRVRRTSRMVLSETNFTRFEVVRSNSAGNMVHIRTSYNNRFLRLERAGGTFLGTLADEPEEDRSKWTCTLFRFVFNTSTQRVGFAHQSPNAERAVALFTNHAIGLVNSTFISHDFGVTDMIRLPMLPRHIVFKGDNDRYLKARSSGYLWFQSAEQTDWRVPHITHMLPNGDVRLLSPRFNRFWRTLRSQWIYCDGTQASSRDTEFRPVRMSLEENKIALLSRSNNMYCVRWPGFPPLWTSGINYLAASATAPIMAETVMEVDEAIRSREISNIRYRTDEARIYNVRPVRINPLIAENGGPNTSSATLQFSYEEVREETFSSSHTWKLSVSTRVRVTVIPVLVTGTIETNASYVGNVEWSKTHRSTETMAAAYTAQVPPMSRVQVTMIVERGSIDVPYSYKQRDVLMDGTHEVRDLDDGLFTGLNTFIVRFIEDSPVPLNPRARSDLHQHYDDNNIVPPTTTSPIPSSPSPLPENYYHDNVVPPTTTSPIPASPSPENYYQDNVVPPTSPIPILPENYDYNNIVPPTSSIRISREDYEAYVVPPTSPIPFAPPSDDEDEVAPRSSKL